MYCVNILIHNVLQTSHRTSPVAMAEAVQGPRPRRVQVDPQQQADGVTGSVNSTPGSTWCSKKMLVVVFCLFFLLVNFVQFQSVMCSYVGWYPLGQCPPKHSGVKKFLKLFDMMESNSFGEIENLPAIIEAVTRRIDVDLYTFRSASRSESEGRWQENVVNKSYEVLNLYREAKDSVYAFMLRGKVMMEDMVNHELDEIQKAFDEGEYDNILNNWMMSVTILKRQRRHWKLPR